MKRVIRMELPPEVEKATDDADYVGAFENIHGELLIYVKDDTRAVLYHSDFDWRPNLVSSIGAKGIILDTAERLWLVACWEATHTPELAAVR